MANRKPHILATCRLGHGLTICSPESTDCDTPYPSTWRLGTYDEVVHLKQLILGAMREVMAETTAPRLLQLTQTRGCKKLTDRSLRAKVSVPGVFPKLISWNSRWFPQTGGKSKHPNPCYMQVGKLKPQILATCRLGNANPKSLLHAGWEIQTPNPCYMQAGKCKPQILATCRLGNSNPKSLLHAGWEMQTPNPCYYTYRLGNSNPKSLLHAGWAFKTPKFLPHAGWVIRHPPPFKSLASWR